MGTLIKKVVTRPMPADAKIVTRNGKQVAKWTDRKGKKRTAEVTEGRGGSLRIKTEAATWTAKYRDGEGFVREVSTGCRDKQAARAVLKDLEQRAEHVKSKILSPEQDRIADHAETPIGEHIEAFLEYQRRKGTHPDRVKHYETKLYETADTCGFRTLCELSVDKLETWLGEQRKGDRAMGAAVYNGYRESWLAFGNWCVGKRTKGKQTHFKGEKRLISNPFDGMARLDEQAERRRRARALTEDELTRLLEAARTRPLIHARTVYRGKNKGKLLAKVPEQRRRKLEQLGLERSLIYKTAVLTGLRANELRTLQCRDLSFGDVPFIKLQHSNEKSRKGSTVALRSDLAAELKDWTKGRQPGDRVFNVPAGILRIMDRDLVAAGIPKADADGCVVHIHALRHSFGTHLSKSGVAPRVAQAAMRHSNINLTMTTYTDARLLDTAEAVEGLPILNARTVAPMVAPKAGKEGQIESSTDQTEGDDNAPQETKKPRKTLGFTGFHQVGDRELESLTSTMSTWRSQ
ncbi:tyrosine-type recombinase/integrase [Roseiconus lacunae]|uniref:tyrosine-type recombinase/integrase n=1 Tax=Roseiconus lacunae TaxID=2605694 RepID=UPI001E659082|nr:site-specific integrase [Roseiconus lacunae]MCD0459207.1 site-specific integrase [Roseiconus lacunae]